MISTLISEAGLQETVAIDDVLLAKNEFNKEAIQNIGTPGIEVVIAIAKKYHGIKPLGIIHLHILHTCEYVPPYLKILFM
jgi:hypothetical protein